MEEKREDTVLALESRIEFAESWLNNNLYHPKYEEGFCKLRNMIKERSKIYNEETRPKQGKLI